MAKPRPVFKQTVCSECGLDWAKHTADRKTDPTQDVCVRLLKAELAARPRYAPFQVSGTQASSIAQPQYWRFENTC